MLNSKRSIIDVFKTVKKQEIILSTNSLEVDRQGLLTSRQLGDDIVATMKTSKHEILKAKWADYIKDRSQSGLTVRDWCSKKGITHGQYYYWLRIIREEALIKAGTLAVTKQTQFVEVKPSGTINTRSISNSHNTCAILRFNGNEIEIVNGADPNTLEIILSLTGR